MRRYVQSHTRRSIYDSGGTPAYDGATITWFDDILAQRAGAQTPHFECPRAGVENFIARVRSSFVLIREHVILPQSPLQK